MTPLEKATAMIEKMSEEDIKNFVNDLENHMHSVMMGTIDVAGGLNEAKEILKNKPPQANAYDIMYKEYGYVESWFMIDHNLTINLNDLQSAVDIEENK